MQSVFQDFIEKLKCIKSLVICYNLIASKVEILVCQQNYENSFKVECRTIICQEDILLFVCMVQLMLQLAQIIGVLYSL